MHLDVVAAEIAGFAVGGKFVEKVFSKIAFPSGEGALKGRMRWECLC